MGNKPPRRWLYTFDETVRRLGTDDESFRQALCYGLQQPEQKRWLRACVDSREGHYLATLDGDLRQKPSVDQNLPALDADGNRIPNSGNDDFGCWSQCGSNRGTGYGAVYELEGVFVVDPQHMRRIAGDAKNGEWPICNLLSVAPIDGTEHSRFPNIHFVIVSDRGADALSVPKDAKELMFIASDVDRLSSDGTLPKSGTGAEMDPRERTSLLCIIGALAEHAKLDLSHPMKAGDAIAAMLPGDVKLSGRTIGEHLKAVRQAMDSRKG